LICWIGKTKAGWWRIIIGLSMMRAFALWFKWRPFALHIYLWGKKLVGIGPTS